MTDARIEKIAKAIAHGHGCKMIYRDPEGVMQTVASSRGYGHWGHSAEQYAAEHWQEYTQAAYFALQAIKAADADGKRLSQAADNNHVDLEPDEAVEIFNDMIDAMYHKDELAGLTERCK